MRHEHVNAAFRQILNNTAPIAPDRCSVHTWVEVAPFRERCDDCGVLRCQHEWVMHYGYGFEVCAHCGSIADRPARTVDRNTGAADPLSHRGDFSD